MLQRQDSFKVEIKEIIVVSASTDRTDSIVQTLMTNDNRIKLIQELKRSGKAAAVNLFLKLTQYNICVLISADVLPKKDTIEKLCVPFEDSSIGMVGSHIIPTNDKNTFMGFVGHMEWEMCYRLSLISPKLGECVAFRKVESIDNHTSVDEAYIESEITNRGLKLLYVPDSIVYNHACENLNDLIKQRRRIWSGQLHLHQTTNYRVSSLSVSTKGKLALEIYQEYIKGVLWTPIVVLLECYCLLLGMVDFYILRKNSYIWDIPKSTKEVKK
jgi:cellulose synthase/poly-beta-1,6-N-acetylglucosamine synthase-like glycosyltransferase